MFSYVQAMFSYRFNNILPERNDIPQEQNLERRLNRELHLIYELITRRKFLDSQVEWKNTEQVKEAENEWCRFHGPIRQSKRLQGFHTYFFRSKTNFL